jgi:hypothetical protein
MQGDAVQKQVAEWRQRCASAAMNWRFCLPARSPVVGGRRRWCSAVGAEALQIACPLRSVDVYSAWMGGCLQ